MRGSYFIVGLLLCYMGAFTSCKYSPLLKAREHLLHNQTIKGNASILKEELTPFYQQLPNRKFLNLGSKPYLYLYLIGREYFDTNQVKKKIEKTSIHFEQRLASTPKDDTTKIKKLEKRKEKKLQKLQTTKQDGNFMMRVMGEPPSYYNRENTEATVDQIKNYYYTKGYFDVMVDYREDSLGQNVSVTYKIKEGKPLMIKKVVLEIEDTSIAKIYAQDSVNSYLQNGMRYDESVFNKERERTFKFMKDRGYYFFNKGLIYMDLDTTGLHNEAILYYIIKNPETGPLKSYVVKDIIFQIDKNLKSSKSPYFSTYNNKKFYMYERKYSKKVLDNKTPIDVGKPYNLTSTQRAQNRLSQLQMFKFVNIAYQMDNDSLVAVITANSLAKYQLSDEFGVNTNVNRQIPGPYGSITFSNRNTFRGCEIFDLSASAGIEGQISNTDKDKIIKTTEINGNAGLNFPQLLLPFGLKNYFLDYIPRTRFSATYISSYRPDYDRTEFRGGINYSIQPSQSTRLIFSPLEMNVINATIKMKEFGDLLDSLSKNGSNLKNTFSKSLVTNTSLTFIKNTNNPLINKRSYFFKAYAELGGLLPTLIAGITKEKITQNNELFGLLYFKFGKIGMDYRHYNPIFRKSTFAFRFSSNFISPINDNGNYLPYSKFVYSGGISSNRAWVNKRLGPGAYKAIPLNGRTTEQPGEFNIECNIEARIKIYKFFGIGIFSDISNVWTLKTDPTRPHSELTPHFYKQLAIGTGLGLRLDFSFFVFRADLGIKTYDPSQPNNEKFRLFKIKPKELLRNNDQAILNLGIGYPF